MFEKEDIQNLAKIRSEQNFGVQVKFIQMVLHHRNPEF